MAESDDNDPPRKRPRDNDARDDDDDRPRRRRRRDDDDDDFDDRPRRRRPAKSSGGIPTVAIVLAVFVGGTLLLCVLVGMLLPAVQKVREAAARMKDSNNLKQITLGAYGFHDAKNTLPPADDTVSWRVHLLPYIEQNQIYQQFDVRQPWDSPANRQLASQPVPPYISVADSAGTVETRYRVFVGPNTLFEPGKPPMKIADVKDGTGNTFYVMEAGETVPWPQPKELPYDRKGPLPSLGVPGRKFVLVSMLDGSVRAISSDTSADVIRGGIEPKDGKFFKE